MSGSISKDRSTTGGSTLSGTAEGKERRLETSNSVPNHLSGHHRDTISQILQHPVGHNIEWRAVVSLLEAVAYVDETRNGKLLVTLGAETETFEPPRHKDIDAQQVVDLRRMLKNAGYVSDAEVPESKGAALPADNTVDGVDPEPQGAL
jgi:hypothetical protein